ncbi:MAG: hypothetical protein R2748_03785 [Bryobacterales bacterium]
MHEAVDFTDRSRSGPVLPGLHAHHPACQQRRRQDGIDGVPDLGPYADMDWPERQKQHASMITRLDSGIGRLMRMLG